MEQQQPQELQIQVQDDAAYTSTILNRLIEHYLARIALPGAEETAFTIERFHRLYQCVLAEGYGQ